MLMEDHHTTEIGDWKIGSGESISLIKKWFLNQFCSPLFVEDLDIAQALVSIVPPDGLVMSEEE